LKRLTGGCGAVAKSLDRSRHQRRLRWQGRSSRPCRQIDGGVTRRANPERCASRAKQTAPLPRRAAFAIGLVALSAGLQVLTPSLSQASLPVGISNPHMALLSNAPQRSGAPIISPPLFLSCLWLRTPVVTFFACSSKPLRLAHTTRPDDAVFFSLASSHSHNHNRSVSAIRGHRGRRIGEGP
jgi:hypothetical protein